MRQERKKGRQEEREREREREKEREGELLTKCMHLTIENTLQVHVYVTL